MRDQEKISAEKLYQKPPSWRDASTFLLIVSNLITIYLAVSQQWQIGTVLFIYWGQAAAIGVFNFIRIVSMNKMSYEGVLVNGREVDSVPGLQGRLSSFFVMHYSVFLVMYLVFILIFFDVNVMEGLPGLGVFFFNHGFSYFYNRKADAPHIKRAVRLLFFPYLRNIPMHIIVSGAAIFATGATFPVVIFLLIKTVVDVALHIFEHTFFKAPMSIQIS